MENAKFSIGERVIALSSTPNERCQKREKGKIYTIKGIIYCPKLGHQLINLGETHISHRIFCRCGNTHLNEGLAWTYHTEFAKIDDFTLQEVLKEENYKLACIIRDNIK